MFVLHDNRVPSPAIYRLAKVMYFNYTYIFYLRYMSHAKYLSFLNFLTGSNRNSFNLKGNSKKDSKTMYRNLLRIPLQIL